LPAVRRQAGELVRLEPGAAGLKTHVSGDDVDERRLARAIGADQAEDLPLLQLERDAVEGDDAAEPHRDIANLEQRGAGHPSSLAACCSDPAGLIPASQAVPAPDWAFIARPYRDSLL